MALKDKLIIELSQPTYSIKVWEKSLLINSLMEPDRQTLRLGDDQLCPNEFSPEHLGAAGRQA